MKEYFVGYDYGMGGMWFYIMAASKKEITSKYPHLQVWENTPSFISCDVEKRMRQEDCYSLDTIPPLVHNVLVAAKKYKHIR